ncbi:MAG: UxaA family hydrolase [Pseudomonadota bacterium]
MARSDPRLIRLGPEDAVLVVGASLAAGEPLQVEGQAIVLPAPLTLGHKIAARDIRAGERVLKYGMPIGVASRDIAKGEHVHVHNMRSDYTPTYYLEEA